jgi:hypothetical protein
VKLHGKHLLMIAAVVAVVFLAVSQSAANRTGDSSAFSVPAALQGD